MSGCPGKACIDLERNSLMCNGSARTYCKARHQPTPLPPLTRPNWELHHLYAVEQEIYCLKTLKCPFPILAWFGQIFLPVVFNISHTLFVLFRPRRGRPGHRPLLPFTPVLGRARSNLSNCQSLQNLPLITHNLTLSWPNYRCRNRCLLLWCFRRYLGNNG